MSAAAPLELPPPPQAASAVAPATPPRPARTARREICELIIARASGDYDFLLATGWTPFISGVRDGCAEQKI